jgi:hypothetical protein
MPEEKKETIETIVPNNNSEVEALKKKIDELSKQNEELSEFAKAAVPVIKFMNEDETISKTFNERWEAKFNPSAKNNKPDVRENEEIATLRDDVNSVKAENRAKAIKDFEDRVGISRLPEKERSEIREKIGKELKEAGIDLKTLDSTRVDTVLEKFHRLVDPKAAEQAEKNGYLKGYMNGTATMPSINGGGNIPEVQEDGKLTPEQIKWAEKLGVDPEKAAEVVKNKDKEKDTPSKAEKSS